MEHTNIEQIEIIQELELDEVEVYSGSWDDEWDNIGDLIFFG